jgi:hypothetical protein
MDFTTRVRGAEAALVAPPGLCYLIEKSGEPSFFFVRNERKKEERRKMKGKEKEKEVGWNHFWRPP